MVQKFDVEFLMEIYVLGSLSKQMGFYKMSAPTYVCRAGEETISFILIKFTISVSTKQE